jgi:hypothetical protein
MDCTVVKQQEGSEVNRMSLLLRHGATQSEWDSSVCSLDAALVETAVFPTAVAAGEGYLILGDDCGTISTVSVDSEKNNALQPRTHYGHIGPVMSASITNHRNELVIVSSGADLVCQVSGVTSESSLAIPSGHTSTIFSAKLAGHGMLATASLDGTARVFNILNAPTCLRMIPLDGCGGTSVEWVSHSQLIVGTAGGSVAMWDLRQANICERVLNNNTGVLPVRKVISRGNAFVVQQGRATLMYDTRNTSRLLASLISDEPILDIALSPCGTVAASMSNNDIKFTDTPHAYLLARRNPSTTFGAVYFLTVERAMCVVVENVLQYVSNARCHSSNIITHSSYFRFAGFLIEL